MTEIRKLPSQFTAQDFTNHLIQLGEASGFTVSPTSYPIILRQFKRLLTSTDPYMLLAVVEHQVSTFAYDVGITEALISYGAVDFAVREFGGSGQEWRIFFYQRYVASQDELDFFGFWLGALEDGKFAPSGSIPRFGKSDFPSWGAVEDRARSVLDKAIAVIEARFRTGGFLEEWEGEKAGYSNPVAPEVRATIIRR